MADLFVPPLLDVGAGLTPSDGSQLFFSESGLSFDANPKGTFTDITADTDHANPVIADGKGVFPEIYLTGTYRAVLKDKNNVQKWVVDNINGGSIDGQAWVSFSGVPTQTGSTTFTLTGDQTATFQVGRRVRLDDSSTLYGTITVSAFTSLTTVTVLLDSGSLSGSLTAVSFGLLSVTNPEVGSKAIQYIPTGTAAVTTDVETKLRERFTITDFGVIGTDAAANTLIIQAAYDAAIATSKDVEVIWPPQVYKFNQITIRALFEVHTKATGARFDLNFSGGAAVSISGAQHTWNGGRPTQTNADSAHHPRMFDIVQVVSFDESSGVKIRNMHHRDVYQFARVFMDVSTFPGKTNYRHTFENCRIENFINGARTWSGSYGIRLDGDVAKNSGGNDTELHNVRISGFETNLYTNGQQSKWMGGFCDGALQGVELDGSAFFNSQNVYFEFNTFDYKYTNSPTDSLSIGTSYGSQVSGFSTGTHGTGGNFGKHILFANIGTGATLNEISASRFSTNTADAILGVSNTGACIAAEAGASGALLYEGTDEAAAVVINIDANGIIHAGVNTSTAYHDLARVTTDNAGNQVAGIRSSTGNSAQFFGVTGVLGSSAFSALRLPRDNGTARSINAGGTVNASGADYAEYMTKNSSCSDIAKGDICGIDSNGELTDVFSSAVTFVIKSTDPSYVGGDTWSVDQAQDESDEDYTVRFEVARAKVDRIAFCGQVPVNVSGNAGEYLIPTDDNGAISGQYVASPTLEQYLICVGKAIKSNTVIVKIS